MPLRTKNERNGSSKLAIIKFGATLVLIAMLETLRRGRGYKALIDDTLKPRKCGPPPVAYLF
jgi:hypothetical protein